MRDGADEVALVRLVSRRYVVEVLDALTDRPSTQRELCRVLRVYRRPITVALRALAAHGAIRRINHEGSWDGRDPAAARFELTDTGHGILDLLNRLEVWDAIYERYLLDHPDD